MPDMPTSLPTYIYSVKYQFCSPRAGNQGNVLLTKVHILKVHIKYFFSDQLPTFCPSLLGGCNSKATANPSKGE